MAEIRNTDVSYLMDRFPEVNIDPHYQRALAEKARDGDKEAENKLVGCLMPMVYGVANDYFNRIPKVELEDLIAAGALGLVKAIRKNDFRPESSLLTYAFYWIRSSVRMAAIRNRPGITTPTDFKAMIKTVNYERDDFAVVNDSQSAIDAKIDAHTLLSILTDRERESLKRKYEIGDFKPREFTRQADLFACRDGIQRIARYLRLPNAIPDDITPEMVEKIDALNARERQVVVSYYGLESKPRVALRELAKQHKLSAGRTIAIKNNAIRKLSALTCQVA